MQKDICIIGGGIIGATTARSLSTKFPSLKIALIEKEKTLGEHTSSRNSSVIHSGLYYSTDSLKAKFCKQGNAQLTQYCIDNKLPLKHTGKFVIASTDEEYERLKELRQQAENNQIEYQWLTYNEAIKIEKNLKMHNPSYNFLFTPTTKVSNNKAVINCIEEELKRQKNVEILSQYEFVKLMGQTKSSNKFVLKNRKLDQEEIFESRYIINAAGLYADIIAKQFNYCKNYTIMPFKGNYLVDKKKYQEGVVNSLIYPIPPKKGNYFLGVHLTCTVNNQIKFGPNAIPALYREEYGDKPIHQWTKKEFQEFQSLSYQYMMNLFSPKCMFYLKHLYEESKKYYKPYVIKQSQKLFTLYDQKPLNWLSFPQNVSNDFEPGKPGIRAQLVDLKTRELINDFIIEKDNLSMHLLNVVSPGWTCSMPIADHITELVKNTENLF
ncbi:hypothetical protein ABPG74_005253 [Tetrahymena malaccensis]